MFGLNHPFRSQFLRGLGPGKFLPVTWKIALVNFKMGRCFRYVRPTIFKVQLGHIASLGIKVNEELQQTKGYCGARVDHRGSGKVPSRAGDSGAFSSERRLSPLLAVDAVDAHLRLTQVTPLDVAEDGLHSHSSQVGAEISERRGATQSPVGMA